VADAATPNYTECFTCHQAVAWNAMKCPQCGMLRPWRNSPQLRRRQRRLLGVVLGLAGVVAAIIFDCSADS